MEMVPIRPERLTPAAFVLLVAMVVVTAVVAVGLMVMMTATTAARVPVAMAMSVAFATRMRVEVDIRGKHDGRCGIARHIISGAPILCLKIQTWRKTKGGGILLGEVLLQGPQQTAAVLLQERPAQANLAEVARQVESTRELGELHEGLHDSAKILRRDLRRVLDCDACHRQGCEPALPPARHASSSPEKEAKVAIRQHGLRVHAQVQYRAEDVAGQPHLREGRGHLGQVLAVELAELEAGGLRHVL